jgi:hypothetical protein
MTDDESDAMLDRLDRGEPAASKEEAEAREPYERLISRIRDLPDENPPDGWESRLEQRRHRQVAGTRRRRRWLAPSAIAALAAAAMVLGAIAYCRKPAEPLKPDHDPMVAMTEPSIDVVLKPGKARTQTSSIGDTLRAIGPRKGSITQLRIYRDMTLVATCPGYTGCAPNDKAIKIDFVATQPGYYRVMVINSDREPPSATKGLELDRGELMRDGFEVRVSTVGRVVVP